MSRLYDELGDTEDSSRTGVWENTISFIRQRIIELEDIVKDSETSISRQMGFSKNYLRAVTNGEVCPSLQGLVCISDYFEMSLTSFFAPMEIPKASDKDTLIRKIIHLRDDQITAILSVVSLLTE